MILVCIRPDITCVTAAYSIDYSFWAALYSEVFL